MARRLARRLGYVLLASVLLGAAALVGVNVYLNGEYLPRLIKSEQDWLTVDYGLAWTVWPGRVHLEDVRVRGEERGLLWELTADRAKLVADLGGLTSRELEVDLLRLSGVSARLRPRLHYLDAAPGYLEALPPLVRGEVLLEEGPQAPPEDRARQAPWTIRISQAEVDGLEELWVDRFRFSGQAHARGSVEVLPGRLLRTGPLQITVDEGGLWVDGKATLKELSGRGTSALGPVDLSTGRGLALLSTLTGDAELDGQVVALAFLPTLTALPVPIEVQDARGPVKTKVMVKDGAILPGAELRWEATNAAAKVAGFAVGGALSLHAQVVEEEGGPRTRCTASMEGFSLGRSGQLPFATGQRASLVLDAPNVALATADQFDRQLTEALERWPAEVSVEQVRVVSQERALQWEARLESLRSRIALAELARHQLRFLHPLTKGVRVRLRPRLLASEVTPQLLKQLPKIEGLQEPPLRSADAPPPLAERAASNPWSVRAEDAVVEELRELWVDAYRFDGLASARGGFRYEAGGRLSAGPITTGIVDGALRIASWSVSSALKGEVEVSLLPFDLQAPEGYGFFRYLTARGELTGRLDDVGFVRHYPAIPFPAVLGGGEGPVSAKVAVREGVVQPGTEVHYQTAAVQVSTHGYRFVGPLVMEAKWTGANGDPRMRLEGQVSPYKVTRVGNDKALLGGRLATLRMDVAKFDLARPSFEPFTTAQVTDGKVYDLRALNEYIPRDLPLKMEGGSGTFFGRVAFSHQGQATGQLNVGGQKAQLVYDKVRVEGDWNVSANLTGIDLQTGEADVENGLLVLNDMAMREGAHARDGWFGRVEMKKGHVRPLGPIILQGDLDTTMRDGRPLVAFFVAETEMLPVWARTLVTLQALRATAQFRLGDGLLEVDKLYARGQSMEIRGRLRKKGEGQWADLLVQSRGQELGLALRGRRMDFKLIGAASWYRDQMRDPKW